jgi:hypothetical protein
MEIIEAIKVACIDEQEIWETDAPVSDGTEGICEGRAEFAGQILRLIKLMERLEDTTSDGYTKGPGPLDGTKKTLQQKAIEASARRTEINTSEWTPDA